MENNTVKRTALFNEHVALGALISPFAGFEMPIQYTGIIDEHNAVRNKCGLFDVSHMGEIMITGNDAEKFINYIFSNDITDAQVGKCFYGMMLNENGGIVDDLLVYCLDKNSFFIVVNASNISKDFSWISKNSKDFDVSIRNLSDFYGELAIQGPDSEHIINNELDIDVKNLQFYHFEQINYEGENIIVSRTGYTGEDGFEIYSSQELTKKFWKRLIESGKVIPCGLGCRDTLRFEVGLPLYGNELNDNTTPLEAGLSSFVKFDKENFIGKEALLSQKNSGVQKKLIGLELLEKAIPRHGYDVLNGDGEIIGTVTTGYHSVSTQKDVALAYVKPQYAIKGTLLKVKIRNRVVPALVTEKKFYKKNYHK